MKGVHGLTKQLLIVVHSTMHVMSPNMCMVLHNKLGWSGNEVNDSTVVIHRSFFYNSMVFHRLDSATETVWLTWAKSKHHVNLCPDWLALVCG